MDAGGLASAAQSGNRNPAGAAEKIRNAPAAASANLVAVAPTEKPVPLAEARPTTAPPPAAAARPLDMKAAAPVKAPANSGKAMQIRASALIQTSATAASPSNKTATAGKTVPQKVQEPVRPEQEAALAAAPLNKQQIAEKRSESRIRWAKALALTAVTGILAFVLGEQFSAQRPGQVEANGAGGPSLAQSNSGTTNASPASGTDTLSAQAKNMPADSWRGRRADPNEVDDVTVRKFPTDESSGKTQKLETIFFDQDSAVIGSQYGASLRRVADALGENPGASAILEGHTDSTGPESYNLELSSRRAIEVRNALVDELHVSTTRLTAVGAGATAPAQPNSSAAGRAYNRRVDVRLVRLSE
jgi:outer membrane protein OmpA-like peptidoglycan-associated protein